MSSSVDQTDRAVFTEELRKRLIYQGLSAVMGLRGFTHLYEVGEALECIS